MVEVLQPKLQLKRIQFDAQELDPHAFDAPKAADAETRMKEEQFC